MFWVTIVDSKSIGLIEVGDSVEINAKYYRNLLDKLFLNIEGYKQEGLR